MTRKRLLGSIRKARARFGDARLSEVEDRLNRIQKGAPLKWNGKAYTDLYIEVQNLLRAGAKSDREALMIVAEDRGLSLPTMQREYKNARTLIEDDLELRFSPTPQNPRRFVG